MPAYSVRQVNESVKHLVESKWPRPIEVEAEVLQVSVAGSGHAYITLCEVGGGAQAPQLAAVCWRTTWRGLTYHPTIGDRVVCRGKLTVYGQRGTVQLTVLALARAGDGDLAREIAARRARLEADGLLDPERKRPLPSAPRFVGVATSLGGAALQDFLKVSGQRDPSARILVSHCVVQGQAAPSSVIQALELLVEDGRSEVLVVTRGGGGKEDLLAFQDEGLARFIASLTIPVVSAVGHQIDITLCDLVADSYVATPTEAAVRVLPDAASRAQTVDVLEHRAALSFARILERASAILEAYRARLRHPRERLEALQARRAELELRLVGALARGLDAQRHGLVSAPQRLEGAISQLLPRSAERVVRARQALDRANAIGLERRLRRVEALTEQLRALSPQAVLDRGFAVVTGPGGVLLDASDAPEGTALRVRVARGEIAAVSRGEKR